MPSHEVVVVGAGMAGLTCAVELTRRGVDTVVLERSDAVGGRIRTDRVDGMLLDRGFQLLNPAYPALAGLVDLKALDLKGFGAGVVVASKGDRSLLADPRRTVPDIGGLLDPSTGSLREKLRFGLYAARTALGDGSHLTQRLDVAYGEALSSHRIDGRLRSAVLEPFLAGVLAEDVQESSRVFVDLLLRMFVRGTPSLPAAGMQSLPEQVAAQLPSGSVHLGSEVTAVGPGEVTAGGASWRAGAVVVATDAAVASRLLGAAYRPMRALTTFYFWAEHSPAARPFLHVDGDRNGPIVNTAVVSDVAPAYCRDGALVAATVLGSSDGRETQQAVIGQLGRIYGVEAGGWDLVRPYRIVHALPVMLPPLDLREPVELHNGLFVAGDHRDTASIQGAIVSGRRAARAVRSRLRRSLPGAPDLPAV